jgi:hypothetical protein
VVPNRLRLQVMDVDRDGLRYSTFLSPRPSTLRA